MKKTIRTAISFLAGTVLLLPAAGFAANTCTEGVGIPPFLSSGAKPNLLMVLDNSGSMLDAAYSKDGSFCFDDTYSATKTYAGYFQSEKWYKWTEDDSTGTAGPYPPWQKNKAYSTGNRVYVNGIIWEAASGGTSGCSSTSALCDSIDEDDNVAWEKIFSIPKWKSGTAYAKDAIVWHGPQLYKAKSAVPSTSSGLTPAASLWEAVDSTWLPNKAYAAKSIVSYKGILYETTAGGTSSATATGVYNDTGVSWKRLDEGSFAETDSGYCATLTASGTRVKHSHADLCLVIETGTIPNQVKAFAAKGRLLNWAASSKFDVEKKILTGGKHNYYDKFLISEHRGCSGSRLIKQLQLSPVAPATAGKFLSLGMRAAKHSDAPHYEDRIDSTDDTGRLEVLAVTDSGYRMSQKCQDAITKIITHGLNGAQNDIDQCIGTFQDPANSVAANTRPTLNNSLQACWQDNPATAAFEITNGNWNNLIADCLTLYKGVKQSQSNFTPSRAFIPAELRPPDGGPYLCYGVYDGGLDHFNRAGYMGRCWNDAGSGGMATCSPWKNTECAGTPKCFTCATEPCYWKYDTGGNPVADPTEKMYKYEAGIIKHCINESTCNADNKWEIVYKSSAGSIHNGDSTCGGTTGGGLAPNWEVTTWPNNPDNPAAPGNCILEAIKDYCDALKVPEVIDPSGSAGKSGETGNAPALLRDSELMAFLGGKDPLLTMKTRIQQADRPKGIVHNVAQDLRLGLMSFRYVGAKSECAMAAAAAGSKLEKYCPQNNLDGAQLLTPLEVGDFVKATDSTYPANGNKRRHVDELAEAINTVRGTSWTPLAEALYEAVGYYAQNVKFCLNKEKDSLGNDTGGCLDFPVCKNFSSTTEKCLDTPKVNDPVQYWCQDNHIIVITEGESTADASAAVKNFTATPSANYLSYLPAVDTLTGDGDDATQQYCVNGSITGTPGDLYGSAFLDNMTWWGQHVKPLYQNRYVKDPDGNKIEKQTVYTHVVTTGVLTNSGTGECKPDTLMTQAAVNGGTTAYYPGEDPQKLEDNLYAVLDDILSRSSAGSAASVISSSRSGSGAVYQAVFWPKYEDNAKAGGAEHNNKVSWIGDVHALFVSSEGLMYEDTDQDGKLTPDEDANGNRRLDKEDLNGNGELDTEDLNGNGVLDNEDVNHNGVLDAGEDLNYNSVLDNEDINGNNVLDTEDVNGNGRLDTEDLNGNGRLDTGTGTDRRIIFYYSTLANRTRGCYDINAVVTTGTCPEPAKSGDLVPPCAATDKCVEIQNINYLWSANRRLRAMNVAADRKIYTWNDADNDGIVDTDKGEWFDLGKMTGTAWSSLNAAAAAVATDSDPNTEPRGPVTKDFLTPDDWTNFITLQNDSTKTAAENYAINESNALKALADWLKGTDQLNTETASDTNSNGRLDKALRSRQFKLLERASDGTTSELVREWRLGDIIHSTPIAVSKPAEAYHFIYRDPTYSYFASRWTKRRTVVYFGGNDGMMHAVNGGFYFENGGQFCCSDELQTASDPSPGSCKHSPSYGYCPAASGQPDLGKEIWAYIPYNLQPHMKCLADRFYAHKYYVDQKPRIFDVQIFAEEEPCKTVGLSAAGCIHPGGWGTILVGSMRFGGSPVSASDWNGSSDKREFSSSFFILDITNPEAEPVLLGELTRTTEKNADSSDKYVDLNYTTSSPSMIVMRSGTSGNAWSKWYLAMGNGPADLDGSNDAAKQALIAMLPLEWMKGGFLSSSWSAGRPNSSYDTTAVPRMPLRLPNKMPGESGYTLEGGRFLVPQAVKAGAKQAGFISDIISVDYNIDETANDKLGVRYCTDALYFGTVDGSSFEKYPASYLPDAVDQFYWNGGGRLFRLVTKEGSISSTGRFAETSSTPPVWKSRWPASGETENNGPVRLLADLKMPTTAAPSVGYDGFNYWVYTGTGRFYSEKDKTDDGWCLEPESTDPACAKRSKISIFGLKEPIKDDLTNFAGWTPTGTASRATCEQPVMTWGKIEWDINKDVLAGTKNNNMLRPDPLSVPQGQRGLMQTDDILSFIADGTNPAVDLYGRPLEYLACYEPCTSYAACKAIECSAAPGAANPCEAANLKCFPGADDASTGLNKMQGITQEGKDGGGVSKSYYTFPLLQKYIVGTGCQPMGTKKVQTGIDGWYRDFHDPRERNLGMSALLGGLLTYTTYQPFNDKCKAEGESSLYGIHFQTGTPWTQSVFGTFSIDSSTGARTRYGKTGGTYVMEKLSLGRGLSTTPSMHVGTGEQAAKAFIQTSTGEIIEINQQKLPLATPKSGRQNWTDRCSSQ